MHLNKVLVFLDGCMAVAGQPSRPGNLPTGGRRRTSDLWSGGGVRAIGVRAESLLHCSTLVLCLDVLAESGYQSNLLPRSLLLPNAYATSITEII